MLAQRRCHDSATQGQDKAFWYLTHLNTVSSIGQDHRQAESCGAMDKTDKFVTALVGSGVAEGSQALARGRAVTEDDVHLRRNRHGDAGWCGHPAHRILLLVQGALNAELTGDIVENWTARLTVSPQPTPA